MKTHLILIILNVYFVSDVDTHQLLRSWFIEGLASRQRMVQRDTWTISLQLTLPIIFVTLTQELRTSVWCSMASVACYNAKGTTLYLKMCRALRPSEVQKDVLCTCSEHRISNNCSPRSISLLGSVFCWCFSWCIMKVYTSRKSNGLLPTQESHPTILCLPQLWS